MRHALDVDLEPLEPGIGRDRQRVNGDSRSIDRRCEGTQQPSGPERAAVACPYLRTGENPTKPLSDSKLADLLASEGIKVARRTVAKYREAMNIASSSERRQRPAS